jgi:uroporphyrin-III C-methyltransferase/precorrin-2 dehydrogenase/sirohydrochlorin ferrochelatase
MRHFPLFMNPPARPALAPSGIVFLVGAGPGAADLLTLRAHRLLGEADAIVHDRLVSGEVLDMGRRDAERIFVGKARANHCMKQEDINALLIRLARAGKRVVRLKGGDPLIFGRGGEEAEALAAAGVTFEIVPGITAALACAADAGIPLTHRDASRAVTLATGHTKDGALDLDFAALARPGATLAIYMGVHNLALLTQGLTRHGFDPATPAALVERGGTRRRRVLTGTLPQLAAQAPGWSSGGPALVLIGDVVGRRTDFDRCDYGTPVRTVAAQEILD